ncbi:decarboxylating 6-phosphogluconate dehydrogenase [Candidatus Curtissbacteria bacterium]|nr:decarboxylating 6-phosphogluconate dehydrogenase [Candidatus Curtissbacteria bacterium]
MKLGFIGLGKMGNRMVAKLVGEGHEVIVWNRSPDKISNFKFQISNLPYNKNFDEAKEVKDLVSKLEKPRVIWSMLPAGEATEEILTEVGKYVDQGDIVIDGGNSKYSDTQRRYESFKNKGIKFLGIGVSGGIIAAKEGYPLMVGGNREAYLGVKPLLDSLAKPNGGHDYFGEGGAGHFVKMVHNGIEYGIMQSIGEGFGILEKSPYNLDLVKVARLYQKGTLVSGFMMERTVESLEADPKLEKLEGEIGASGEGLWTVEEGKKLGVPVEIIEASLDFRTRSQQDKKISSSFAARMVAALRNAFGGHEIKKKSS